MGNDTSNMVGRSRGLVGGDVCAELACFYGSEYFASTSTTDRGRVIRGQRSIQNYLHRRSGSAVKFDSDGESYEEDESTFLSNQPRYWNYPNRRNRLDDGGTEDDYHHRNHSPNSSIFDLGDDDSIMTNHNDNANNERDVGNVNINSKDPSEVRESPELFRSTIASGASTVSSSTSSAAVFAAVASSGSFATRYDYFDEAMNGPVRSLTRSASSSHQQQHEENNNNNNHNRMERHRSQPQNYSSAETSRYSSSSIDPQHLIHRRHRRRRVHRPAATTIGATAHRVPHRTVSVGM